MNDQASHGALGALPVIASSRAPIVVEADGAYAKLMFDTAVLATLMPAHVDQMNEKTFRIYLLLDRVKGKSDATVLQVYLNLSSQLLKIHLGSVALFGLRQASLNESGGGMQFILDVSAHSAHLLSAATLAQGQLNVLIRPTHALPNGVAIDIGQMRLCLEKFTN